MVQEDFEKTTAEEGAKTLFQLAWSIVKDAGNKTIDKIKVEKALKNYKDNYIKRHGQIKVLGMLQPIPLLNIYTSVKLIHPSYLYKDEEIETLEKNFRNNQRHFGSENERLDGIEIVNKEKKINILGAPGSGKSTFLKRIGLDALLDDNEKKNHIKNTKYNHESIPVLIELRRFKTEKIDIKKLIQSEFEIAGFPDSGSFVESALKKGNLLILLDGLDEVPTTFLDAVIQHLGDFTDKYDNNRFVTSCRTAFYKTFLKNFTDVEIANFDNKQIEVFIKNWFSFEKDKFANTADTFINLLFSEANESTFELARTPLLLTFLCLTFDESQRFPANRSSLYRRALLILLERWAAEKRIHNDDIYQDFTSDIEIEMLAEVAAKLFTQDKIFFYQNELKDLIKSFLVNTLGAKSISLTKIIEAIEVQQGLLVQRAPLIYSFSHLTIQEYLTAHYYFSPKRFQELTNNYLFNEAWREVFLLISGIANADDMLIIMNENLKKYIISNRVLMNCVQWINNSINDSEDFLKDASKRIFLASLILRFKRYDSKGFGVSQPRLEFSALNLLNLLNPSFEKSLLLTENINSKEEIKILNIISQWEVNFDTFNEIKQTIKTMKPPLPFSKMLQGSRHKHRKTILSVLYKALNVPDNLGELNRGQYTSLTNYLTAYSLIVECKNSSLRTSKDVWKTICLSILKN